jgi:hypothetical protein
MLCRRPPERASAPCRTVQSRVPRSGLSPDYATLIRIAAPLHDASTTRGAEVASTLTLPPKRRGRESTGGCQVLRFAACLTRPDGTSARTLRQPSPVETTHPHRTERRFGMRMVPRGQLGLTNVHPRRRAFSGNVGDGRTSSSRTGDPSPTGRIADRPRRRTHAEPVSSPRRPSGPLRGAPCSGRHSVQRRASVRSAATSRSISWRPSASA